MLDKFGNIDRKLISIFILLIPVCISRAQSRFIQIDQRFAVAAIGGVERAEIDIPIPHSIEGRQEVHEVFFSHPPNRKYQELSTSYAKYEWTQGRPVDEIKITIKMELMDYDWKVAQSGSSPETLKKSNMKRYTRGTGLYRLSEKDDIPFFESIEGQEDKVRSMHSAVVDRLEYMTRFGRDLGASYAWNNEHGDCTEYADLLIAMCRREGIPARRVSGYTISSATGLLAQIFKASYHAWLEVYFDEKGWIPFDPTHSDGSNVTSYDNLQNKYIYLHVDNPEGRMKWRYWGGRLNVNEERTWKEFVSIDELTASKY